MCTTYTARCVWRVAVRCVCSLYGSVPLADGGEAIVLELLSGGTLFSLLHEPAADGYPLLSLLHEPAADGRSLDGTRDSRDEEADERMFEVNGARRGGGAASKAGSMLDIALRMRIMRETASGIAYLHANRYMHRDIKPTNVLLDAHRHAKVANVGLRQKAPYNAHRIQYPLALPTLTDTGFCILCTSGRRLWARQALLRRGRGGEPTQPRPRSRRRRHRRRRQRQHRPVRGTYVLRGDPAVHGARSHHGLPTVDEFSI